MTASTFTPPTEASVTADIRAGLAARHQGQAARTWKPALGWEQYYEVSDDGLVRRFEFSFVGGGGAQCTIPAGPVRQWVAYNDYLNVTFQRHGIIRTAGVHVLIAEAFLGPRPGKWYDARHLDGNRQNNILSNIAWGTRTENHLDTIRHGMHYQASKTHCAKGHPYDEVNTLWRIRPGYGTGKSRECLACRQERNARRRASRRAPSSRLSMSQPPMNPASPTGADALPADMGG